MIVRDATAADLDALAALAARAFPEDAWSRAMLAEELDRPGGVVLVGEGADGLVGFAIGLLVLDQLEVLQIAVDPAARRAGHGRALLAALERRARWQAVAWLEVRTGNEAAIALYTGAGWSPMGVRRRYYRDGADALVMRKPLPQNPEGPKR